MSRGQSTKNTIFSGIYYYVLLWIIFSQMLFVLT